MNPDLHHCPMSNLIMHLMQVFCVCRSRGCWSWSGGNSGLPRTDCWWWYTFCVRRTWQVYQRWEKCGPCKESFNGKMLRSCVQSSCIWCTRGMDSSASCPLCWIPGPVFSFCSRMAIAASWPWTGTSSQTGQEWV